MYLTHYVCKFKISIEPARSDMSEFLILTDIVLTFEYSTYFVNMTMHNET